MKESERIITNAAREKNIVLRMRRKKTMIEDSHVRRHDRYLEFCLLLYH
jgi:hypothetical protein